MLRPYRAPRWSRRCDRDPSARDPDRHDRPAPRRRAARRGRRRLSNPCCWRDAAAGAKQAGRRTPVRISILGSVEHNFFTNGSVELFDCARQGRIDAFFLGGGQIDGRGNINLVGAGGSPRSAPRWPGSFGSAYLYFTVPRVILFREEHSPRVFVQKVDFTSAPGTSPEGVHRTGGPVALVTGKALFGFDRTLPGFTLESLPSGPRPSRGRECDWLCVRAYRSSEGDGRPRPGDRRAPSGAGYEQALRDLQLTARCSGTLRENAPPHRHPRHGKGPAMNDRSGSLADIKVVDASRVLGGPFCGQSSATMAPSSQDRAAPGR